MNQSKGLSASQATGNLKKWPAGLLSCWTYRSPVTDSQACWPLFFPKACLCPALLLGANESLIQREEAADVCCFQPQSLCGPSCRALNTRHLHLGNEGVRTCTHVLALQGACACLGLGWPMVAWMVLAQRERVVLKLGLLDSTPSWLACLLLPCGLFQVAAALEHQRYFNPPPPPSSMRPTSSGVSQQQRVRAAPGPLALGLEASRMKRTTSGMSGPVQPTMSRCSEAGVSVAAQAGDCAQSPLVLPSTPDYEHPAASLDGGRLGKASSGSNGATAASQAAAPSAAVPAVAGHEAQPSGQAQGSRLSTGREPGAEQPAGEGPATEAAGPVAAHAAEGTAIDNAGPAMAAERHRARCDDGDNDVLPWDLPADASPTRSAAAGATAASLACSASSSKLGLGLDVSQEDASLLSLSASRGSTGFRLGRALRGSGLPRSGPAALRSSGVATAGAAAAPASVARPGAALPLGGLAQCGSGACGGFEAKAQLLAAEAPSSGGLSAEALRAASVHEGGGLAPDMPLLVSGSAGRAGAMCATLVSDSICNMASYVPPHGGAGGGMASAAAGNTLVSDSICNLASYVGGYDHQQQRLRQQLQQQQGGHAYQAPGSWPDGRTSSAGSLHGVVASPLAASSGGIRSSSSPSGTSGSLTASQQELAVRLANFAAAARLGEQRAAAAAGQTAGPEAAGEPFYPTVVSEICNLADTEGGDSVGGGREEQTRLQRPWQQAARCSPRDAASSQPTGPQEPGRIAKSPDGLPAAQQYEQQRPLLQAGRPTSADVDAGGAPGSTGRSSYSRPGRAVAATAKRMSALDSIASDVSDEYDGGYTLDAPGRGSRTYTVTPGGNILETAGVRGLAAAAKAGFGGGSPVAGGQQPGRVIKPTTVSVQTSTGLWGLW